MLIMLLMDIQRIRSLLGSANIPATAEATKLSVRTLYRIKAGESNITLSTMNALQKWAKGRRVHHGT
jgi:hypothetical protein